MGGKGVLSSSGYSSTIFVVVVVYARILMASGPVGG